MEKAETFSRWPLRRRTERLRNRFWRDYRGSITGAAAHYARVLRFGERLSPAERAEFLERRSRACYITDDIDEAIDAVEDALELRRELGQRLEEGESLTWLSTILWCPGRTADSVRAARQAVALLETLPPGRELANAYVHPGRYPGTPPQCLDWSRRRNRDRSRPRFPFLFRTTEK